MRKNIWVIIFVACNLTVGAQQLPIVYNQFFMNPYVYNPAYAGVEGHAVVFATYKKQWLGINGAPSIYNANFHIPLKGGLAFGASAYSRQAGPYNMSSGKVSAGYLISIDREHFFRFGMSLGAGNNTLNFNEVEPNDITFSNLTPNSSFMLGDVGVAYHFGHFNVGVSLPKLFNYEVFTNEDGFQVTPKPQDNILFKMNYRGHLSDDIAIEPHLLYRYSKFYPSQYEATVILHLLHIVWVGASYRQDAGVIGLIGAKLYEKIGIGYSYEYGNPANASQLGATHEIHIGYHIGTRKEHAEHVSSFIKSHRNTAAERAKEAELERQKQLQALQKSRQAARQTEEDEDALGLLGGAKTEPEPKPDTHWSYEKENDPVERVNQFGETERGIKFDRINEQGEKEVVFSWLPPPPPGATEETYEIASPTEEPMIRTKPDGTKEAGIKWIRTIDGTKKETLVIWDEILTEEEAGQLDHNPSTAMSLDNAVISIKADPVAPIQEEQPVVEESEAETEEEPIAVMEEKTPEVIEEEPEPVVEEEDPITEPTPEVVVEEQPVMVEEEKGDATLTDDFRSTEELANSSEHLEVKRGSHMLELPAGNYVVAGVFESFQNAENLSDELFQRGYRNTKVGYLTARGYYYVVIFQSDSLNAANNEKNSVKSKSGLTDVWVLKVNE